MAPHLADAAQADSATALRDRFEALRLQGTGALFDRPLFLQSTEADDRAQGDVYARLDHGYALLRKSLLQADRWCAVLLLHLNTQYCRAGGTAQAPVLDVGVGRKFDQPLAELYWMKLGWRVAAADDDRLHVVMQAAEGPFGTRDFRIEFEAVPLDGEHTLMHLAYGYGYGSAARFALNVYLGTIGRGKQGFSVVGQDAAGKPLRAGGLRGLLERNTVRYQLAIESFLGAQALPPARQWRSSVESWFDATERYPPQLHEVERSAYIEMKLAEAERSATTPPLAP
jgi:hypothetical protein